MIVTVAVIVCSFVSIGDSILLLVVGFTVIPGRLTVRVRSGQALNLSGTGISYVYIVRVVGVIKVSSVIGVIELCVSRHSFNAGPA